MPMHEYERYASALRRHSRASGGLQEQHALRLPRRNDPVNDLPKEVDCKRAGAALNRLLPVSFEYVHR